MSTRASGGRRTALAVGAVGLGLVLIGAGVAVRPDDEPRVEVAAGTNRSITAAVSGAGGDGGALAAWSSPALVANPTDADQLVVAARLERPQLGAGLARSGDGGTTWSAAVAVSDNVFDATVGPEAVGGGADPGSRLGLVSTRTSALAVWPDTRAGTPDTGRRDLYFAPVRITPEQ